MSKAKAVSEKWLRKLAKLKVKSKKVEKATELVKQESSIFETFQDKLRDNLDN